MFSRKGSRDGENFHASRLGGLNTSRSVLDGDGFGGFDDFQVFEGEPVRSGIRFAFFSVFGGDDGSKVFFDVMSRDDRFNVGSKAPLDPMGGGSGYFYELNGTRWSRSSPLWAYCSRWRLFV